MPTVVGILIFMSRINATLSRVEQEKSLKTSRPWVSLYDAVLLNDIGSNGYILLTQLGTRERSGSVVECLTRDRRTTGSSLTGVTALWSLSKTHLS